MMREWMSFASMQKYCGYQVEGQADVEGLFSDHIDPAGDRNKKLSERNTDENSWKRERATVATEVWRLFGYVLRSPAGTCLLKKVRGAVSAPKMRNIGLDKSF